MHRMKLDRRSFLKVASAGVFGSGLILAVKWDGLPAQQDPTVSTVKTFQPNIWLKIGTENKVTVYVVESEMGQGPYTLMPMILAEELETAWSDILVEHAPVKPAYGWQMTGGSSSIRKGWATLRSAGAVARQMLIQAAARQWNVPENECSALASQIVHSSTGNKISFGELALAAADLPIPEEVNLKTPDEYRLIGTAVPRLDLTEKVNGSAQYGTDVEIPDMYYATTVHCPVLGGRPVQVDTSQAKKIPGVHQIVTIDNAVAVVADDTWRAMMAADTLKIKWDKQSSTQVDSGHIHQRLQEAASKNGSIVAKHGDVSKVLKSTKTHHASYTIPFQAHAPMEPMNCTAWVTNNHCEVWAPTQSPSYAHTFASRYGLPKLTYYKNKLLKRLDVTSGDSVKINTTLLGGGFGRRLKQDFVAEAVQISKAVRKPVKLTWRRQEDIQHDFYHPYTFHAMAGSVDASGKPIAWQHRIAGIGEAGHSDMPYAIPNVQIETVPVDIPVPIGPWRSVQHHYYAFAKETFFDELANFGKQDPLELRLELLQDQRLMNVLELAAEKAGWGTALADNHYLGLAVHQSFGTYVAEAVEIIADDNGNIRLPRVVVAIDCGIIINPDIVAAQMESSVVFALSAAFKSSITLKKGRVQQSNYHDFPILRIDEMPKVDTYFVKNDNSPQGIGEPAVPPFAPALANAIFSATGQPVRQLPIENMKFIPLTGKFRQL